MSVWGKEKKKKKKKRDINKAYLQAAAICQKDVLVTCLDNGFSFPKLLVEVVHYVNTTPKISNTPLNAPSTANPKGCPFPSISFPVRLVWHWGVQPGRESSRLVSNWESRGYLFGVPISQSRCKKCKVKVKIPSLPQLISHTTSKLIVYSVFSVPILDSNHCLFNSLFLSEFGSDLWG